MYFLWKHLLQCEMPSAYSVAFWLILQIVVIAFYVKAFFFLFLRLWLSHSPDCPWRCALGCWDCRRAPPRLRETAPFIFSQFEGTVTLTATMDLNTVKEQSLSLRPADPICSVRSCVFSKQSASCIWGTLADTIRFWIISDGFKQILKDITRKECPAHPPHHNLCR